MTQTSPLQRFGRGRAALVLVCSLFLLPVSEAAPADTKPAGETPAPAAKAAARPSTNPAKPATKVAAAEPVAKAVEEITCAELAFMAGDDKQVQDVTYLMIWAYGVRTGAEGIDLKRFPLTEAGLRAFAEQLLAACDEDSDAKFVSKLGKGAPR